MGLTTAPVPMERRIELVQADVTLDGWRARITGHRRPFATVTAVEGPAAGAGWAWAWETADRVVRNGGRFRT